MSDTQSTHAVDVKTRAVWCKTIQMHELSDPIAITDALQAHIINLWCHDSPPYCECLLNRNIRDAAWQYHASHLMCRSSSSHDVTNRVVWNRKPPSRGEGNTARGALFGAHADDAATAQRVSTRQRHCSPLGVEVEGVQAHGTLQGR